MRIRTPAIVLTVALTAILALGGPASAGGRPDPPPNWLGPTFVGILILTGALLLVIVAIGVASRRDRP